MRELRFKCLNKDLSSERTEWIKYGVMSKPHCIGGTYITPDLQYTGLKDKNGVEIYEGDIILTETGYFSVYWKKSQCSFYCRSLSKTRGIYGMNESRAKESEIIGNIYENPDFLKENKTQKH